MKYLILFILFIFLIVDIHNTTTQNKINKQLFDYIQELSEVDTYFRRTTLSKPDYNAQGALLIYPDGSAYIPVLFKDQVTLEKHQSEIQWENNLKGTPFKGYYNIKKIYVVQ